MTSTRRDDPSRADGDSKAGARPAGEALAPAAFGPVDFRATFESAPIGMLVMQRDTIVAVNRALCAMFRTSETALLGQPFGALFPDGDALDAIRPAIDEAVGRVGQYREHRLLRQRALPGADEPELIQVSLQYLHLDAEHLLVICAADDLARAPAGGHADLTPRERDVAMLLRKRYTAKEIGKCLGISHRTVEVHRSRLMRKYGVNSAAALLRCLLDDPLEGPSAGQPESPKPWTPPASAHARPLAVPHRLQAANTLPYHGRA